MLAQATIERELREHLPPELQEQAPAIADVLAGVARRKLAPEQARARLEAPEIAEALRALAGQRIPVSDRGDYISIGDISNAQNVAVGQGAIAIGSVVIDMRSARGDSRVALLAALAAVVALALLAAVVLVRSNAGSGPRLPAPSRLALAGPQRLAVTALALAGGDLWIAAREEGRTALYRLEWRKGRQATPQKITSLDGDATALAVDCRGNVWIALSDIGARVYRPANGQISAPLNRETTGGRLPMITVQALGARCLPDGAAEVWLGGRGLRRLTYRGDMPGEPSWSIESAPALAGELDDERVNALLIDPEADELWVAGSTSVARLSFLGVLPPKRYPIDDAQIWSIGRAADGTTWVGGIRGLFRFDAAHDTWAALPLQREDKTPSGQAHALAADRDWVWIGESRCAKDDESCWPLAAWSAGTVYPIRIQQRQVRALARDPAGNTWIGTEDGLIVYPVE